jgi:hypothetical protein
VGKSESVNTAGSSISNNEQGMSNKEVKKAKNKKWFRKYGEAVWLLRMIKV